MNNIIAEPQGGRTLKKYPPLFTTSIIINKKSMVKITILAILCIVSLGFGVGWYAQEYSTNLKIRNLENNINSKVKEIKDLKDYKDATFYNAGGRVYIIDGCKMKHILNSKERVKYINKGYK